MLRSLEEISEIRNLPGVSGSIGRSLGERWLQLGPLLSFPSSSGSNRSRGGSQRRGTYEAMAATEPPSSASQRFPSRRSDDAPADGAGGGAPTEPAQQQATGGGGSGRRAGLLQFVLVSHSFTGLIFARPDDAPPIQLAGCCGGCCVCLCCGKGRLLTVRHRLFIFLFTLVATFFVTLFSTLGIRSGWWAVAIVVFLIVPLTCWLKGSIPPVSEWLNSWQPDSWRPNAPRVEELLLVVWLVSAVVVAATQATAGQIIDVARNFAIGLAIANAIEFGIILLLYCPCRCCCPCLMPPEYDEPYRPYDGSQRNRTQHQQQQQPAATAV